MKRELSPRELDIVRLCGYSCKDIANKLHISVATVKTYIAKILQKLNVKSRTQMLLVALRNKWLDVREIDCGFWDESGCYVEDRQLVDMRKL